MHRSTAQRSPASTSLIAPLLALMNDRTSKPPTAVDLLGADFAAGLYKDESVGEPTDKRQDFDDDEIVQMMRKQEPRLLTVVAALETSGRHFTKQMMAADGIYLKRVPGKGVGLFAARNFSVGDFVPSHRRFEEMHFEGCPPEIRFKAGCESDDVRNAIRPVACEVMGRFTCDRHTDRTSVRNTDAFISSYDWDLLINHGDESARNVKTRHYRRDYANAVAEPYRFVTNFEVIKPIAKDEECVHLDSMGNSNC
jgi:hypothetical protein